MIGLSGLIEMISGRLELKLFLFFNRIPKWDVDPEMLYRKNDQISWEGNFCLVG